MKSSSFLILALLVLPLNAGSQARKPSTIAELVTYRGADREALLYAGAKTEGKVIWYTSLAGDSYKELVKAFENKYPGVKVDSYRAAGAELVVRLQEEAKAKRNIADAIETTEGSLIFLRDDKDLTGKRGRDLKNAYVTGVFDVRGISQNRATLRYRKPICTARFHTTHQHVG